MLGCPKIRLSCRGEEWLQGSDVKSLSGVSGGEPVYILKMQPLGENDIRAIAAEEINDVDAFVAGGQERQLEHFFGNPETLKLYLKVYKNGGGWPETRGELMEESTWLLISEENELHERARGDAISDKRLMRAAEDLSAVLLFGDKEGVALSRPSGSDLYIPLQELSDVDLDAALVAARRRVFSSDTPEQVHPQHKTTGDYLAAKALVRRIKDKSLPLGRALSLLTGKDGGPLSHMRDIYAWLVALLPEHAEQLIEAEPFGTLIYGDAGQWSVATRRTALKLLSAYAENKDPWFRAGSWYAPLLGGLAHPELVEEFRNILRDEPSPHVISVVLSALEYGKPLPEMGDDLLTFIHDPDHAHRHWLKDDALRTFARICPERLDERKALLAEVRAGTVKDEDHMLRVMLLAELYPSEIEPDEVVHYFAEANIIGSGTIGWFVRHDLLEKTSDAALPVLADAILANPDDTKKLGEFDRRELNGALACRLLEVHGDNAKPEQIYTWLGIYMDRHHTEYINKEDSDAIRVYFKTHPQIYVKLFRYWLDHTVPNKKQNYRYHYFAFRNRLLLTSPPFNFPETILTWAITEANLDKSTFLFDLAADMVLGSNPGTFNVDKKYILDFVEAHSIFAKAWRKKIQPTIPNWQLEQEKREHEDRKKRKVVIATNVNILLPRIEYLRTGKDVENLNFGAMQWFGLTYEARQEDEPVERIRRQTNDKITEAIIEGFVSLLKKDSPHAPGDIVDLNHKGKRYCESFAVLAGADILAARSRDAFLALPDANLKAALAFHLVHSVGSESRSWDQTIMAEHPGLAREVLAEIWRAQLAGGKKEHLDGAYVGRTEDISTPIILSEIPILLSENPALPPRILENFLIIVLRHGDTEVLRPLTPMALADRRVRSEARIFWLAVATLLSPDDHVHKLDREISLNVRHLWAAHGILTAGASTLMHGQESAPQLHMTISILGKRLNNIPFLTGPRTARGWGVEDAAQSIRGLIDTLAGLPSEEAARAFETLIADRALHEWHAHLRHGQAIQAKNLRDAQFDRPSAQKICALLGGGAPTNMKDFQALALDILNDIAAAIRGDNANLWKSFWILAGRGNLDKPKIENDSRDAMLPWIRPYLSSRAITIEPESAAADNKRVDIRLTSAGVGTLPIEVKRDDNTEMWTAMRDQLLVRYANDPNTGGYGIYLVIWHGKGGNGCKPPPKELGIDKPTSAIELQTALEGLKPDARFVVRAIDVSKPHE